MCKKRRFKHSGGLKRIRQFDDFKQALSLPQGFKRKRISELTLVSLQKLLPGFSRNGPFIGSMIYLGIVPRFPHLPQLPKVSRIRRGLKDSSVGEDVEDLLVRLEKAEAARGGVGFRVVPWDLSKRISRVKPWALRM